MADGLDLKKLTKPPQENELKEEPQENILEKSASKIVERQQEIRGFRADPVFRDAMEDTRSSTNGNTTIMTITPFFSAVIAPAVMMFTLGLDPEQIRTMWAVLIANLIAFALNSIISVINLRNATRAATINTYRTTRSEYENKLTEKEKENEILHLRLGTHQDTIERQKADAEKHNAEIDNLRKTKYEYDLEKAVKERMKNGSNAE